MTSTQKVRRPLGELIRHRGYWRWATATMLLRLPSIMGPLALVLVSIEHTGSPALGGLLVGITLIPGVIAGPLAGRVLDRIGTARWTPRVLLIGAIGRVCLAVAFVAHAPAAMLIAIVLVSTVITSGVSGATRTLLTATVPQRLIGPALSIDSIMEEAVVIIAPFVVVLTALVGSEWSLIAMAVCGAGGALLLHNQMSERSAAEPAERSIAEPSDDRRRSIWRNPEFLFWVLVTLAFGHLLGTADIGVLPKVIDLGGTVAHAALLIGALGVTSALAGLTYAFFVHQIRMSFVRRACLLLGLMIASSLTFALVDSITGLLLAFVALGLWTAPLNAVMYEAPEYIVAPGQRTESFSVLVACQSVGFAMAGGLLAVFPVDTMLLLGTVTAAVALASAPILIRGRRAAPAAVDVPAH